MQIYSSEIKNKRLKGSETIQNYLLLKDQYPLLTQEQEKKLLVEAKNGNEAARKTLIQSNIGLVVSIAKKYVDEFNSIDDLVQDGMIGFITAVDKYDITYNYRLSTYAVAYIKKSITEEAGKRKSAVTIPATIRKKFILSVMASDDQQNTEEQIERVAAELGAHEDTVNKMINAVKPAIGINEITTDVAELSFTENSANEKQNQSDPLEKIIKDDEIATVKKAMQYLTIKERVILSLRYGLDDGVERSLEDIGEEFDCIRQRTLQIINEAQNKLKKIIYMLEEKSLGDKNDR